MMEHVPTFNDLKFETRDHVSGVQAIWTFANGYGASVIRGPYSYGGPDGLYELAVLRDGRVCCTTPLTDDVLGYLTEDEVTDALAKIAALPKRGAA